MKCCAHFYLPSSPSSSDWLARVPRDQKGVCVFLRGALSRPLPIRHLCGPGGTPSGGPPMWPWRTTAWAGTRRSSAGTRKWARWGCSTSLLRLAAPQDCLRLGKFLTSQSSGLAWPLRPPSPTPPLSRLDGARPRLRAATLPTQSPMGSAAVRIWTSLRLRLRLRLRLAAACGLRGGNRVGILATLLGGRASSRWSSGRAC